MDQREQVEDLAVPDDESDQVKGGNTWAGKIVKPGAANEGAEPHLQPGGANQGPAPHLFGGGV
jgi:hypothetical protein